MHSGADWATADGKKELLGTADGYRESEESWKELLLDLKRRGLEIEPKLDTGDESLGFWKALPQVFGTTRAQRCWKHKTANVLNYLPKGLQAKTKRSSIRSRWLRVGWQRTRLWTTSCLARKQSIQGDRVLAQRSGSLVDVL